MMPPLLNDRYRVIRTLGTGGFSDTFLAEDTYLPSGRSCVIKRLRPVTHDPEVYQLVRQRFQREAAILENLGNEHPQIPKLYAYFTEQNSFYLVQEWIDGLLLDQHRMMSEAEVRRLLLTTLPILDFIHHQGVIHRDIKPANLILRQQDNLPVLIDFGVAKEIVGTVRGKHGQMVPSIIVGTPGFMAPEQAAGRPLYASDLYSLGVMAIFLLLGKLPRSDLSTGKMVWSTHGLSESLVTVLEKAIDPVANDRYPSAQAMLADLQVDCPLPSPLPVTDTLMPPSAIVHPIRIGAKPSHPTPPSTSPSTLPFTLGQQSYRNRQILLNKVRNYWIKGVLETSLYGRALLELGLASRLDLLDRPWGMVWETPEQPQQTLPAHTRIIHKFDELGAGRTLLILGEPGGGKTTTLLELARDLLQRAEQTPSYPLPVVFNLSSWTSDRQPIGDWLVEELYTRYQVSKEIGKDWVQTQQILPLLDGLDEVNTACRNACVQALNQFIQNYGQTEVVVCSRIRDYESLAHRLRFQGAVLIQPLTLAQVQAYLDRAGDDLEAVKTALAADTVFQELVRSPLMLNLITLTYQGMSITELPSLNLEQRRAHLFNAYINRMFHRRGNDRTYSQKKAMTWLIWLARMMIQHSQTLFQIEGLQPAWLPTNHLRWQYAIAIGLLTMPCFAIGIGWVGHLVGGLWVGIMSGLIFGIGGSFASVLIFGLVHDHISPVETLKWSWRKARQNLRLGLAVGLVSGGVLGVGLALAYGPLLDLYGGWWFGLIYGPIAGLSIGFVFVLLRGLMGPSVSMKTIPNQGIRQSFKNAVIFAFVGMLGLGLTAAAAEISSLVGVIIGVLFGLFGAGEACIKHIALRLVLYQQGAIPCNYAHFLDYATRLIFLQKVGGGYIFIHRLLLEHFASLDIHDRQPRF